MCVNRGLKQRVECATRKSGEIKSNENWKHKHSALESSKEFFD